MSLENELDVRDWSQDVNNEEFQTNCTFLTQDEQFLIYTVKFWLEGVLQVDI